MPPDVSIDFEKTVTTAGDAWACNLYSTTPGNAAALKRTLFRWHDSYTGAYSGESVTATMTVPVVAGELLDLRFGLGGTNGWLIISNVGTNEFTFRYVAVQ